MHLKVTVADPGEGPGLPPPLFLDQTNVQRAEKCFFFATGPPSPPPHLVEGLDPPLSYT